MSTPINISASRGAAILGLSKWQTPDQVWLQIMESRQPGFCAAHNYELPVVEYNAAMRWGHAFESAIIELAEKIRDNIITDREKFFSPVGYPFITCHIDGKYDVIRELHEGKTTTIYSFNNEWGEPGTDRIPLDYQIQCQHQMICTGFKFNILSVLVFPRRVEDWEEMGWEIQKWTIKNYFISKNLERFKPIKWASVLNEMGYFHQYKIPADPELQKLMIEHYTEWWEKHIIEETPPKPRSYDDIRALMRAPKGTIIVPTEIESLIAERNQIKEEIKGTGPLAQRAEKIKVNVLDWARKNGASAVDEDTMDKMIFRDQSGKKIGSYYKNKNGVLVFR